VKRVTSASGEIRREPRQIIMISSSPDKIFDFIESAVFAGKVLRQGSPDPAGLMRPGGISGNSLQAGQEQTGFFPEGFIQHNDLMEKWDLFA